MGFSGGRGGKVEAFLREQGIGFKTAAGEELVVDECPFCGNSSHCYINRNTGAFSCKKCMEEGSFYTFQVQCGAVLEIGGAAQTQYEPLSWAQQMKATQWAQALQSRPDLVQQLATWWCISQETVYRCQFGIGQLQNDDRWWLSIPIFANGAVVNIKYRTWIGYEKAFTREQDAASALYNIDMLNEMSKDYAIVAEGEKDSITLLDMGFTNVLGNSGGAGTFKAEWYQLLEKFEMIYLCYDGDLAGDRGMRKQVNRFGYERCKRIVMPQGKDINDLRKEGLTKEQFEQMLDQAEWFELPGVVTMNDAYSDLRNRIIDGGDAASILTPWTRVNYMFGGGLFDGTLTTLVGPPKTMKTAVITAIAEHNAKRGFPVLLIELEMTPEQLAKRDVSRLMKTPFGMIDTLDVTLTQIQQKGMPLYITRPGRQRLNWRQCIETIKAAYKRYGIALAIIDHVHFLVRNAQDKTAELGIIFQELALLSKELDIPIVALAQPNKSQDDRVRDTYNNVGWTNAAATDSDLIVVLHRFRTDRIPKENQEELQLARDLMGGVELNKDEDSFSPIVHMYVDAGRSTTGGHARLWADPHFFGISEIDMQLRAPNASKSDPIINMGTNGMVLV